MRLLPQLSRADRQRLSVEHGIERRYRIRERLADGAVRRTFWFVDRDEADAFLFGAIVGSDGAVVYDFATTVAITSVSGSVQSWPVPSDFGATNNSIEAVGCGGSGGAVSYPNGAATGGGGGGWARVINAPLPRGGSATFFLYAGPQGGGSTSGAVAGSQGPNTWMRIDGGSTAPSSASQGVQGGGGGGGGAGIDTQVGGFGGGTSTPNVGNSSYAAGQGGSAAGTGGGASGAGGGSGAAGPNGTTAQPSFAVNDYSNGSDGDMGHGGAGGAGLSSSGGSGTEIGGGNGSGGGGAGTNNGGTAGSGGNAGGGGGGASWPGTDAACRGGTGGRGLIVVVYTFAPSGSSGGNMPMLGI